MPMDRKLYPANWEELALAIKAEANWHCEQCGRPCRMSGEDEGSFIERICESTWEDELCEWVESDEVGAIEVPKLGRFTLTVAHLNHIPSDCSRENLKALCAPCHCRYDLKAMPLKRRLKQERLGQMSLIFEG